jgi:hypothetical protein
MGFIILFNFESGAVGSSNHTLLIPRGQNFTSKQYGIGSRKSAVQVFEERRVNSAAP